MAGCSFGQRETRALLLSSPIPSSFPFWPLRSETDGVNPLSLPFIPPGKRKREEGAPDWGPLAPSSGMGYAA